MKVTQEKLPASQIGLEIEIPPEMSKSTYERVLQNLSRTANIPGFRKGKVPRHVLLQRLGAVRVKAAAVEELIQNGVEQALKQESIEPLGNYHLLSSFEDLVSQFQPGEPLTFSASVDVQPSAILGEYTDLKVKAEEVKPDPDRVNKLLETRRSEMANLIPAAEGRPAQLGDVAVVDYTARYASPAEGEADPEIQGVRADNFQVELLPEKFVPGFVDGIVGMNPGETREISVQFPEDYPNQDLAGQQAIFTIALHDLKEKELPELNDEFAREVSEFQTLAELREELESRFKKEAEDKTKANKQEALLNELLSRVEMEIPATLINQETDVLLRERAIQMESYGINVKQYYTQENLPKIREQLRPEAIGRIKEFFGLQEIAKRESIAVEPAALEARVKEVIQELSGQSVDIARVRQFVEVDMLREKTLEWLEAQATVELVPEGSLAEAEAEAAGGETAAAVTEGSAEPAAAVGEAGEAAPETPQADEPAPAASGDGPEGPVVE
ncbi:trigger factor [Kamptonema formosum]|uniref:trigger factor n=1 Tax=Kamptonema formosum TaxID=331992 RepID=UPI000347AE34|nr:trigger factor [Oscillatoria sp. PCC 10802]